MNLVQTPGGVMLPNGLGLRDVMPGISARETVGWLDAGGVQTAPVGASTAVVGPTISYQEIYETQPIIAAVVNKIVRNICRVPLRVKRRKDDGSIEDVEETHPLVKLIKRPARGRGELALKQWMTHPTLVQGNAVIAKHRAKGKGTPPTELYPLDWRYLSAYRLRGGFIDYWVTAETGRSVGLPATEVIHVGWQADGTAAGQIGVAPLRQLADPIRVDDAARRFAFAMLVNTARPGGGFVLPAGVELTDELKTALRAVIDVWTGVDAAGGTPIIAGGADWKRFDQNAVEAELVETRRRSLEEVCVVYDVSPIAIGDLKYATQRGNVAELNQDFFGNTLGTHFALGADALNVQLIEPEDEWREDGLFIEYDPSEFLRGDPKAWAEALEVRVRSGGLTLNQRLKLDGLPPVKDPRADELLIADNNMTTLSALRARPERDLAASAPAAGVMVALFPPADTAAALALDGGEAADQLHVTLAYLGDAADLDAAAREMLAVVVAGWAAETPVLAGELSGVGLFTAGEAPVTYLSVDVPALAAARQNLVERLVAAGLPARVDEHGFTPHMTLAYANRVADAADLELGAIAFESAVVAISDDHQTVTLTGPDPKDSNA